VPETLRRPNPVDIHVGGRIRMRRQVMGLSQKALAEAVDLPVQALQDHERGGGRVDSARLFALIRVLQVPVDYFFADLPEPNQDSAETAPLEDSEAAVRQLLAIAEGPELAQLFLKIPKGRRRQQALDVVRALAEGGEPEKAKT
jgi:transcriptional regulator with XRE-family HTH domain